jgi:hypothetical protein
VPLGLTVFVIDSQIGNSPMLTAGTLALIVGSTLTSVAVFDSKGFRSATLRSGPKSSVVPGDKTPVGDTKSLRPPLVSVGVVPGVASLKATSFEKIVLPADAAGITQTPFQ